MRVTTIMCTGHMKCLWKGVDMAYKIIITKAEKKPSNKCWSYTPSELDYLIDEVNEEKADLEMELYEGRLYELEETDEGL